MGINANRISMMKQWTWVPWSEMHGLDADGGSASGGTSATNTVDTAGDDINAMNLPANGDMLNHMMMIPSEWDLNHDIDVEIIFSTESETAADTILWKFSYAQMAVWDNSGTPAGITDTLPEVLTDPKTAVSLNGSVAKAVGTTVKNTLQKVVGTITGGTISTDADFLSFFVEMDTKAAGLGEAIHLHGVRFVYTPRYGIGGVQDEAPEFQRQY